MLRGDVKALLALRHRRSIADVSGSFWRLGQVAGIAASLALAVLLVYGGALRHAFVWDDHAYLEQNAFLRSPRNLLELKDPSAVMNAARPVWILSAMADVQLWGLSPRGHHLTSLILHAWNALLVLALARAGGASRTAAWLGALLFAVHPLAAEAVCMASFRPSLLAGTGMACAVLCALRMQQAQGGGRWAWLGATLASTAFALGSKETAAVLPLLCLLWMPFSAPSRLRWMAMGLLAALVTLALVLRAPWSTYRLPFLPGQDALAPPGVLARWNGAGEVGALLAVPLSLGHLLLRCFWPFGVGVDLRFPATGALRILQLVLLAAALLGVWKTRGSLLGKALGWVLLTALPTANLVPMPNPAADRYAYVPLMGLALAAGLGLARLLESGGLARIGVPLFLGLACLLGRANGGAWRDDEVLWNRVIRVSPASSRARSNAGVIAVRRGRQAGLSEREALLRRAEGLLGQARALAPDDPWPEAHLGRLADARRDFPAAAGHYAAAIRLSPRPVRWLFLLQGDALWKAGDSVHAVAAWKEGLRLFPDYGEAIERLKRAGAFP